MPNESTELTQNVENEMMRRQQHPQQQQQAPQQDQQEVKLEQHLPIEPTIHVEQPLGMPPPLGPPPPYQDIYPVQPQYWNDQPWSPAPPPPPPPPRPLPSPTLWPTAHVHSDRHHVPVTSRSSVHMIGGQIIQPTRVPATVRWFFGTITFMMIFSIVCAFVYVLIIAINFK